MYSAAWKLCLTRFHKKQLRVDNPDHWDSGLKRCTALRVKLRVISNRSSTGFEGHHTIVLPKRGGRSVK